MAACTICTLDPCPHLILKGGSAGAPIYITGPAKYAPSLKPHCVYCDRIHRNIGIDNQPVCAWRTYSRAKGEDFAAFTPDAVDEFARWYRSGGWAAPTRKAKAAKAPKATSTSVASASSGSPTPAPSTPTVAIPSVVDFEDEPVALPVDDPLTDLLAKPGEPTGPVGTIRPYTKEEDDAAVARAEKLAAEHAARPKPSFAKTTDINEEAVVTI